MNIGGIEFSDEQMNKIKEIHNDPETKELREKLERLDSYFLKLNCIHSAMILLKRGDL